MKQQSLTDLLEKLWEYEDKFNEYVLAIDLYLDYDFTYNGIKCYVHHYDIDLNKVEICSYDGETWLSEDGKFLTMTFEELDNRCVKI